jgi:proline racemase
MHNEGYSTMCGHGVIAVTTIALERGLIMPGQDGGAVVYDSPAGTIRARARRAGEEGLPTEARSARAGGSGKAVRAGGAGGAGMAGGAGQDAAARVESVSFVNVPSFVLHGGLSVKLASRQIRVDVAFGGAFYAIVDSEAVGLPIDVAHLPELRRVGMEIKDAIESVHEITHPLERGLQGIYGTIFTGPPSDESADLRNVTVFADAEVDRSPCGTGTAAVMAVVEAMGLLSDTKPFVHESLIGTRFTGRVSARTVVGELEAIVPEIEGSAWITGEHTFLVDDDDPLKNGFRI